MVWQPETLKDEKQKTLATMGRGGRFPNFHQAPMGGDQVEQHVLYVEQGGLEAVQLCTKHVRNQIILAKVKK